MDYRSPAELKRQFQEDMLMHMASPSPKKKHRPVEPEPEKKSETFSNKLPDDPTALVREVPLAENLEALSAALEHDEAVQRHMESHNLSLEDSATYIMTNGSTGQKMSFFSHIGSSLEGTSPKRVMKIISIMVDSMWAQDSELQLSAPEALESLLSILDTATAGEIYEVTITMLTVKTLQVREAWGRLLLALLNHLSQEQLEHKVIPLALKKTEHAELQDQRELSCNLLGTLCKHIPVKLINSVIVPKALALCQDTNVSVRRHICKQLSVICRSLGIDAAEKKIAPEIFELLTDEEHCVSCTAFSCLLDLVEFFGSQYRKEKLFPIIKSYMMNPPTEVITLLVGDFGRFLNEIKTDITSQEDVLLFANFFMTASQKLDDTAKWHCAFNFPALSANPVDEVRRSIAAGLHELISILGDKAAIFLEKPFLQLLPDKSWPVRYALFSHIDKLLDCFISQFKGSQKTTFFHAVADHLLQVSTDAEVHSPSWRTMEQVLRVIDAYIAHFDEGVLTDSIVPQMFTYIKEGANSLKGLCARIIVRVTHRISNVSQQVTIVSRLSSDFGRSQSCFQRQAFFLFLREICELFSSRFIRERLFEVVQELHRDSVIIVRLAMTRSMVSLGKAVALGNNTPTQDVFSTMVQRLLMDENTTVREAMVAAKDELDKLEVRYKRDAPLKEKDMAEDKRREQAELPLLEAAKESDKAERRAKLRDLLKSEREKDFLEPHTTGGRTATVLGRVCTAVPGVDTEERDWRRCKCQTPPCTLERIEFMYTKVYIVVGTFIWRTVQIALRSPNSATFRALHNSVVPAIHGAEANHRLWCVRFPSLKFFSSLYRWRPLYERPNGREHERAVPADGESALESPYTKERNMGRHYFLKSITEDSGPYLMNIVARSTYEAFDVGSCNTNTNTKRGGRESRCNTDFSFQRKVLTLKAFHHKEGRCPRVFDELTRDGPYSHLLTSLLLLLFLLAVIALSAHNSACTAYSHPALVLRASRPPNTHSESERRTESAPTGTPFPTAPLHDHPTEPVAPGPGSSVMVQRSSPGLRMVLPASKPSPTSTSTAKSPQQLRITPTGGRPPVKSPHQVSSVSSSPRSTPKSPQANLGQRAERWGGCSSHMMTGRQESERVAIRELCTRIAAAVPGSSEEARDTFMMLIANLKDPLNTELRARIISGELPVEVLTRMGEKDLVNPECRRELEKGFLERSKDKDLTEIAKAQRTSSKLFQCPACKAKDCSWVQRQTRSGDEPMTVICDCNVCNHHWRKVFKFLPWDILLRPGAQDTKRILKKKKKLLRLSNEGSFPFSCLCVSAMYRCITILRAFLLFFAFCFWSPPLIEAKASFYRAAVRLVLTGKITTFDEADDILNKNTTIAEVKGLIQIRFGFNVSEIVIIKDHLVENDESLESVGIVGAPNDPVLTAHVVRETELEPSNVDDGGINEFSHSDFILAMKMLGKPVPISDERLIAMRVNAPRQRPAFLNAPAPSSSMNSTGTAIGRLAGPGQQPPADHRHPGQPSGRGPEPRAPSGYNPRASEVFHIFENVLYGLRKEGVDEEFQLHYPGMDPLPFWDMRTPDAYYNYERECELNEICLELFYFGEFKAVKDKQKLLALVHQSIDSKAGVRVRTPLPLREAGCMYPLIAVPIVLSEVDAMVLGDRFFEDFGKRRDTRMEAKGTRDANSAGVIFALQERNQYNIFFSRDYCFRGAIVAFKDAVAYAMADDSCLVREENQTRKRVRSQESLDAADCVCSSSDSVQFTLIPLECEKIPPEAAVGGSAAGKGYTFGPEGARVGRDPGSCDLHLPLRDISGCTAFFPWSGKVYVRDMSFNGTFVNGRLVGRDHSVELADGDMISVVNPFLAHAALYSYTFMMPRQTPHSSWHPVLNSSSITALYTLGAMIGQGSYATVYAAREKMTGAPVAIKVLDKQRFSPHVAEDSLRLEAELTRSLRHPNIVQVYNTVDTDGTIALIMEMIPDGDLFDYVVGRGKCPFTEEEARFLFLQLVEPVRYIHSRNILHCDLKPENILIARRARSTSFPAPGDAPSSGKASSAASTNASGVEAISPPAATGGAKPPSPQPSKLSPYDVQLKLTDFGVAQYCRRHARIPSTESCQASSTRIAPAVGTPAYAAPELLDHSSTTPDQQPFPLRAAVDMWSLGVLLYVLCSGSLPKRRISLDDTLVLHKHMAFLSSSCRDLLGGLLAMDPQKRLTMGELLRHPWLGGSCRGSIRDPVEDDWSLTASPLSPRYSMILAWIFVLLQAREKQYIASYLGGLVVVAFGGKFNFLQRLSVGKTLFFFTYQDAPRFQTWRKHCRNLYQQLFFIDLVWESPCVQLMPYATAKDGVLTQTILCGTRTGGQEQNYLQMLGAALPLSAAPLEGSIVNDVTREVGGYGYAPHQCGLKVERRLLHDGDVLAARYMPANPLLLGSCSSNGNTYVFDWSRVSLNKYPNDPPRPRAPLPPNELTENPTEEERSAYQKKMRALNAAAAEQERWDKRSGPGQHTLTLKGNSGTPYCMDWSTAREGVLAVGSLGKVCVWQVGTLSKDDPRVLEPLQSFDIGQLDDLARVTGVEFFHNSNSNATFVASTSEGSVLVEDMRMGTGTEIFSLPSPTTSVALSSLDPNTVLVGSEDGEVYAFDLRMSKEPYLLHTAHAGEVTTLSCCPHSRHLFASGGIDGTVCIYNVARGKELFRHAGHTERVMDLGWSWQDGCEGQLISCDVNCITLWRPRDYFFVS
eukprot:gene4346-3160_t